MQVKDLILTQLSLLKVMGKSRRKIEMDLGYSTNYIDQALSKGGNEKLLQALVDYKDRLENNEHDQYPFNTMEVLVSQQKTIETLTRSLKQYTTILKEEPKQPIVAESVPESSYIAKRREQKLDRSRFLAPLVPIRAQAGYRTGYNNTDFVNKLKTFEILPGIDPHGTTWRFFEVQGESMRDTLAPKDMILCSAVTTTDWQNIKDNYIYIILTPEELLIKRVVKKSANEWSLKSDNKGYPPKNISTTDILEVWKARRIVSADLGPKKVTKHYDLD